MRKFKYFSEKIILIIILLLTQSGFWYFESSPVLRVAAAALSIWGIFALLKHRDEKPNLQSKFEILNLTILYLGVYTFYNLIYGLSIPIFLIMIALFILSAALLYIQMTLDKVNTLIEKPNFHFLVILMGLVVLEVFLGFSFWPIDPKIKTLLIVILFFLIEKLFYFHVFDMLRLKRIFGYVLVSFLIFVLSLLSVWFGFSR